MTCVSGFSETEVCMFVCKFPSCFGGDGVCGFFAVVVVVFFSCLGSVCARMPVIE